MKKKDIKLQLKEIKTFDEAWRFYKNCPNKFTYRILRQEILETALKFSDKLYQTEKISIEKLTIRLAKIVYMQMIKQTNNKLKLRAICLYCETRFPHIYLQAMRKREKIAEEHKNFDETLRIATDAKSQPIIQNHVLLLSIRLAKNREDCRRIIAITKPGFFAYEKVFQKMNRLNH